MSKTFSGLVKSFLGTEAPGGLGAKLNPGKKAGKRPLPGTTQATLLEQSQSEARHTLSQVLSVLRSTGHIGSPHFWPLPKPDTLIV